MRAAGIRALLLKQMQLAGKNGFFSLRVGDSCYSFAKIIRCIELVYQFAHAGTVAKHRRG
jgi:hypothetical protein